MARKASYRVMRGLSYKPNGKPGKERRAEPGQVVTDLPPRSVPWLVAQRHIIEIEDGEG